MEKKSIHEIIATVFKAVALAMGIAVVVLSRIASMMYSKAEKQSSLIHSLSKVGMKK